MHLNYLFMTVLWGIYINIHMIRKRKACGEEAVGRMTHFIPNNKRKVPTLRMHVRRNNARRSAGTDAWEN